MRLLHRYVVPKRSAEVQTVFIAGDDRAVIKGTLYDLHTTAKLGRSPAHAFARDGAWVEWRGDALVLVAPGGAVVPLHGLAGLSIRVKSITDDDVLLEAGNEPWLCISRATGEPRGRLEGQRGEPSASGHLFVGHAIDPRDGHTVWLVEGGRVAQFDLPTRRPRRELEPAADERYLGIAPHPSGAVVTIARARARGFDTSADELVLIDATDRVQRRVPRACMSIAPLHDGFVAFEPATRQFVRFDLALNAVDTLAHDSAWATILPLPSGRSWISVGGTGGVDHHGDDDLVPTAPPPKSKPTPTAKRR